MSTPFGGWRHRMRLYRDAAAGLEPTSLVVCMDAYDALSMRSVTGLVETFRSFGKPLVLSLESECFNNCVPITEWWQAKGIPQPEADRYVNGGLLIGYASAIVHLYDWMLRSGATDDQRGLGRYALAHPEAWAPDIKGQLFKNRVYGAQLSGEDLASQGTYFAHFPGMADWSADAYNRAAEHVLKDPETVASKNRGTPARFTLMIVLYVLTAILSLLIVCLTAQTIVNSDHERMAIAVKK